MCPKCGFKFENLEENIQRLNERFEYDTQLINKNYAGNILNSYANLGWKLHTAVNEGEQLMLIFERRIKTIKQVEEEINAQNEKFAQERSDEIRKLVEYESRADVKRQRIMDGILNALRNQVNGCSVNVLNDLLENKYNVMDLLVYLNDLAKEGKVVNDSGKWKVLN